ncbi:hypothetical protein L9F63_000601, partial [Diploptera punctata]
VASYTVGVILNMCRNNTRTQRLVQNVFYAIQTYTLHHASEHLIQKYTGLRVIIYLTTIFIVHILSVKIQI